MKTLYTRTLLIFALTLLCRVTGYAFAPELDGTMMPYRFDSLKSQKPWGDDMKPVFINYVARHGARFISSAKKVSQLREFLEDAAKHGLLTPKGDDFLRLLNNVEYHTAKHWGMLTPLGVAEEAELGTEFFETTPELLSSGRIEGRSTYVPRVIRSMYSFCHSLAKSSPDLFINTEEGKEFNPLLRFFNTNKDYAVYLQSGPWMSAFEGFRKENLPVEPAAKLVNEVIDGNRLQDITEQMYGVLQSLAAANIPGDPSEWFTESQYRACWEVSNLKHYYQRSWTTFSPIAAEAARPLLDAIVASADSAFAGTANGLKADLWFGHAETILPLEALMRLPGCYEPVLLPDQVADNWQDWNTAPLGANIMMVCLKDAAGNDYVAIRLNGKWTAPTGGDKVVPWAEVKSLWQNRP